MQRLMLAALLAIGLAGCGTRPAPTPVPPTPTPTPQQIAAQAADAMAALTSAHFTLEIEGQQPPTALGFQLTGAEGDTVAPDRLRAKLKARLGQSPIDSELVVIGNDRYIQNPLNRRFEKLTLPLGHLALLDKDRGAPFLLRNLENPTVSGRETVDGVECDVLSGQLDAAHLAPLVTGLPAVNEPVQGQAWIGRSDRLIRKVRLSGPVSPGEPAGIVRTLTLSAFNQHVTIERPGS